MDDDALRGLGPMADAQSQARACQYFEQLKAADTGWQLCANVLANGMYQNNDHVKFFCFQVIEHFLKTRYMRSSAIEQQQIKSFLMTWLQVQSCSGNLDKSFIRNKAAQIFSLTFIVDYPHKWPTFFSDILQSFTLGQPAVDMYLRILVAIDSEVVDREIVHSHEESERNTRIKDAMRDGCVQMLVDSWFQILTTYRNSNPEMTCLSLDVIGAYISWIDINLIANNRFVGVLMQFMTMPLLRESACDCIHEIVSKGMDPVMKTKLIESFASVLQDTGVMAVSDDEEGDFLAKLSKLVNTMGINLIGAWQRLGKVGEHHNPDMAKECLVAVENKVPLMLTYLGNEDDDVSAAVAGFSHEYLDFLKQMTAISPKQKENFENLLFVTVKKMKYDESYNFDSEGEEEAMFQEYRKQLRRIMNHLATLDTELFLVRMHSIASQSLMSWKSVDYQDVEVAILLVYQLAEAIPSSAGHHFTGPKADVLLELMRTLMNSGVSHHPHSAVTLQFFETIVRYERFFLQEPQHLAEALIAFLDERGLRNSSPHVRSRSAYLFSRFVKGALRSQFQDYVEDILKRMQDLLILSSPDNGHQHLLTSDDQLFIYETASILIVGGNFPPEKKQLLMKELLSPILNKFGGILNKMQRERDEQKQLMYAECLASAMAFASRTSKGFSAQMNMKLCGCSLAFTETLKVFLSALGSTVHRQRLHAGVRQFLHRMVVCLDGEILPFIPVAMESLLKSPDARELHDFIPLMNQLATKFKNTIVPFLEQVFMPFVTTIFQVLQMPTDERDQVTASEKRMLHRSYFLFISCLLTNNIHDVLANQEPQNIHQVLLTIIQGARDEPDPPTQKMCFLILRKLVTLWGDEATHPAFHKFTYENILPACFLAPMKTSFDLSDAQTVLVLNEVSSCMKTIHEKKGNEFIKYLQTDYLPTLNLTPEKIQEYCQALKSEPKMFKSYMKVFFTQAKS
ncbi:exportin-T-like [Lineus longissimus]|uniref:exportin-T-like n=1 Tax=Lineus longissimus TaxID=88925 RepID=UPI002B4E2483